MQRIFKYGSIQNIILTPDKELNILINRSPSYVIILKSYTLLNMVRFLAHPVPYFVLWFLLLRKFVWEFTWNVAPLCFVHTLWASFISTVTSATCRLILIIIFVSCYNQTRNSSGDEIANVNFLYDDIIHALQNIIRLVHKFGYGQIDAAGTQVYRIQ